MPEYPLEVVILAESRIWVNIKMLNLHVESIFCPFFQESRTSPALPLTGRILIWSETRKEVIIYPLSLLNSFLPVILSYFCEATLYRTALPYLKGNYATCDNYLKRSGMIWQNWR